MRYDEAAGKNCRRARERLLAVQGGACALCKTTPKRFVVDHCHRSGEIRALLCYSCNVRVGYYEVAIRRTLIMDRIDPDPVIDDYLAAPPALGWAYNDVTPDLASTGAR